MLNSFFRLKKLLYIYIYTYKEKQTFNVFIFIFQIKGWPKYDRIGSHGPLCSNPTYQ